METENDCNVLEEDISLIAGTIVTNALRIPKSLYCPFCADEYMFEFTLKDHLKRKHANQLKERANRVENCQIKEHHMCPYCTAEFYLFAPLPKHIANSHGLTHLQEWKQKPKNLTELNQRRQLEPSVLYAACSPGLSEVFEKLEANDGSFYVESPSIDPPRSILKKTPNKPYRTISSPSGVSIRRSKSEIVKRSLSVRRELRFDLPPLEKSPDQIELMALTKQRRFFSLRRCFLKHEKSPKKSRNGVRNIMCSPSVVTSTPINFLDDYSQSPKKSKNSSLVRKLAKNRPLLFGSERFQCGYCKQRYCTNPDLLSHLKEHTGIKFILRPRYRCGQCGLSFYRNKCLVRHCHFQHTPQKMRI